MTENIQLEMVDVSRLHPAAWNPRVMPPEQMAALERSLSRWGFVDPIVARREDGLVIGGHQRLEAAKALGMEKVPVVFVDLPLSEVKGLNIALNRVHGDWDSSKLATLFDELSAANFDLELTGFDQAGIDEVFAAVAKSRYGEEDEAFDAEEAMAKAEESAGPTRVQPGEVWSLGRHRLICGDATDATAWARLMEGYLAQAVITDPPYGVGYVGGRAAQEERISKLRRGVASPSDTYWDDMTPAAYRSLLAASLGLAYAHSDDRCPLYLWFASAHLRDVLECLSGTGWQERNLLVWFKGRTAGSLFSQYKHAYEPCFYAFKRGQAPRWHGSTNEVSVWEYEKAARNELHPTMKPLLLIERTIRNATIPGQLVVDPFLGSGTAIIAAEREGRVCYGMELEARYADVILARWTSLTGQEAVKLDGQA